MSTPGACPQMQVPTAAVTKTLVVDATPERAFRVFTAGFHTDVEVRFVAEGETRTRVEFEHRDLDRYGAQAAEHVARLGSEGGWNGILNAYAAELARNSA